MIRVPGASKGGGTPRVTRSVTTMFDFNEEFPVIESFTPPDKLPDYRNIVGVLRSMLEVVGMGSYTVNMATREVAKLITAKWFHDSHETPFRRWL